MEYQSHSITKSEEEALSKYLFGITNLSSQKAWYVFTNINLKITNKIIKKTYFLEKQVDKETILDIII
jgi:ATP-dependent protease ClpP protease subunit